MKRHTLPLHAQRHERAIRAAAAGIEFCLYEAEPGDPWRALLIGPSTWNGGGFLPSMPGWTIPAAVDAWMRGG